MKGIVIAARSDSEYRFIQALLKKLGVSSTTVSEEEMEDLALSKKLKLVNRSKKVSRQTVMTKLRS